MLAFIVGYVLNQCTTGQILESLLSPSSLGPLIQFSSKSCLLQTQNIPRIYLTTSNNCPLGHVLITSQLPFVLPPLPLYRASETQFRLLHCSEIPSSSTQREILSPNLKSLLISYVIFLAPLAPVSLLLPLPTQYFLVCLSGTFFP